ncbi:hypothetical protein Vadar_010353 [Vaccinium darrowii]|uniref:Uncharacterized protein n=1 Tax=Vaccinium darrowii TaxID=229202 RepID=A0ACB7XGR5_9ERIC|nr:hypothetical protein Vadar_010353 [Vaccinium darrowii]
MGYSEVVAVLGVGALAAWGLTKLVSSSSSSALEENNYGRQDCWRFPDYEKLKMNTDGSMTNSEAGFGGRAGFGVVIRGDLGGMLIGFYGRVRDCSSSSEAELWGIYKGLQIIQENNWREVEIETDLRSTVELINGGNHAKSAIKEIVEECKVMMLRTGCTLKLISDKANKVADDMANRGRDQDEDFVLHSVPPDPKMGSLLVADYESAKSADPKKWSLVFADYERAKPVWAAQLFHRF